MSKSKKLFEHMTVHVCSCNIDCIYNYMHIDLYTIFIRNKKQYFVCPHAVLIF